MTNEAQSTDGLPTETDKISKETVVKSEDEDTWSFDSNKQRTNENVDNTTAPSIDEITTQQINAREKTILTSSIKSLIDSQLDENSDDDDDGIRVIIDSDELNTSNIPTNRERTRGILTNNSMSTTQKQPVTRGVDIEAQGFINGKSTFEFDIAAAYKDDDKPWKKPGADITDYFNYGFTEETWVQYCDRQRRLRNENTLARHNPVHFPPMIIPGHPPAFHQINPHPMMMIHRPMNMQMMQRPMNNTRIVEGKIDVIGASDKTTRRPISETANNIEQPSVYMGSPFITDQPPDSRTAGDSIPPQSPLNGPMPSHGPPAGSIHPIQTLGIHRLPLMPLPHGMQYRTPINHLHAHDGLQFFPHAPTLGIRSDRPMQPYLVPHHPQQPWDKPGIPAVHGFPPRPYLPQVPIPETNAAGQVSSNRSPTPENRSTRSVTPEETRIDTTDNDKTVKEDRYKERYRDEHEHSLSSQYRSSPKDRLLSSYHSRHRSREHEYERPRSEKKSSGDRDDKSDNSRKRRHKEDNSRYYRDDDESSRNQRSSRPTPSKTNVSPLNSNLNQSQSSQASNEPSINSEQVVSSSSSPGTRSRRDDSERSSSRHKHHKKASKRSRNDSDDERSRSDYRRRSRDR